MMPSLCIVFQTTEFLHKHFVVLYYSKTLQITMEAKRFCEEEPTNTETRFNDFESGK